MNVNVAFKLTIARFLTSSIILVIVQSKAEYVKNWFEAGGLVEDASILIILMTFQYSIVYGLNIPGIVKWVQKRRLHGQGGECRMTQKEANTLCEGPLCDVPNLISNLMNFLMTCIFYSPLIPIAIPCALVGLFLNYWVMKYMLFRIHKQPESISVLMATFFANFMPWIALFWAISFLYFVDKIRSDALGTPSLLTHGQITHSAKDERDESDEGFVA